MKRLALCIILAAGLIIGCSKTEPPAPAQAAIHHHEHKPPHGGAPVELGDEENHVEFVIDTSGGRLQAFVLDGELENFVRIAMPSLEITAQVSGRQEKLTLEPVANNATGEKVGDTALFEAQADWLKTTPTFDAVLKKITIHSKTYTNISFNFPKAAMKEKNKSQSPGAGARRGSTSANWLEFTKWKAKIDESSDARDQSTPTDRKTGNEGRE